jgi:hypothetical protein
MKTLLLALGLVVMSAASSMAGPHESTYYCNAVEALQLQDNEICG